MNYYFIANNPHNKNYLVDKKFTKEDIIVVFNVSLFENFPNFKNSKKNLHFYRAHNNEFHGCYKIKECYCSKYYIGDKPSNSLKEEYKNFNINYVNFSIKTMKEKLGYKDDKEPMLGSIVFEYLKINSYFNPSDIIYLVGFTGVYDSYHKNPLYYTHKKHLEDSYFNEQSKIFKIKYINNHIPKN